MKFFVKIFFVLFVCTEISFGQIKTLRLWETIAPGSENLINNETYEDGRFKNVNQPELSVFLCKNRNYNTPTIIIFPGGGYNHITFEKEGIKLARWLNENGINAFILKYRLNENLALIDAQRAVSFVRAKAIEFDINPNKIGILGFSAGGHLAANMIINKKTIMNDKIDSISCTPDFAVLIYPWLQNLYQKVQDKFPPTFIVHASDDKRVPVEQSINFFNELIKNNIPVEMHIYDKGGHGFAIEPDRGRASSWVNIFLDWLKTTIQ
ncbi:MAG: alpha/beta hydrolase [Melioribacter sp.]|uniref:alpha/beta hydrolase n=1 Tax=Rosettibacter primus TaxID=3111523 RepID=UPI00247DFB19|nr:alpha/beta hydrolase [Melioribacter sp.]